ncbi:hypothetical protein GCM10010129_33250 [Streptomyces fumigatiscleroticus]|nr:hypothetical protein GCM10010129_33250 [Streptomyces fumigatiscleroticus]
MSVPDIVYARGWDAEARREVGPLSREEAERRDGSGEPYVVVRRAPGRAEPLEVHLVAWRDHYVGQWAYDELGRRTHEVDLRLLEPDRLFLRHYVQRRYASPDQPDRARDAWRVTVELFPEGKGRKVLQERGESGGSHHTLADVPESRRWHPRSAFGVRAAGSADAQPAAGPEDPVGLGARADADEPRSLWRPPRPAGPGLALGELFWPGARFTSDSWGGMTVDRVRHIATLRVPSGRLVVADPMYPDGPRVLTERIPPGAYPLQAPVLVGEGDFCGERFPVTEEPVVRLLIRDEPALTWTMALSERDDPRLLLDGHAYGFATDGAAGGFADASAWDTLSAKVRRYHEEDDDTAAEPISDGCLRVTDEETGSDLVSFCTEGDGTWPVWLGRSATGEPVAVAVVTSLSADLRPE